MYEEHFGLSRLPFNVTPDPEFFYFSPMHESVLARLQDGVRARMGLITVSGEPGTGKTLLVKKFVESVTPGIRTAISYDPRISCNRLLRLMLRTFGLPASKLNRQTMMERLIAYLRVERQNNRTAALLVDESQALSDAVLEQVRLLSSLEEHDEKLLQIVLVGQSEFQRRLARSKFARLKQRVALHLELQPLSAADVEAYVHCRLSKAGYEGPDLIESAALERIVFFSKGIPRLINSLCDNALLATYQASDRTVSADKIDKAAHNLSLQDPPDHTRAPEQEHVAISLISEPKAGVDESDEDQQWQENFTQSVADSDELPALDQSHRHRSRLGPMAISMVLAILVTTTIALLIYRRPGAADSPVSPVLSESEFAEENYSPATADDFAAEKLALPISQPAAAAPVAEPTPKTSPRDARVFVHVVKRQDRPVVEEVGNALRAAGYEIPDTRVVSGKTAGDVRFFFPQDRDEANKVRSAVEAELKKHGYQLALQLLERDGTRFQYATPGKIEVWLPPLTSGSAVEQG